MKVLRFILKAYERIKLIFMQVKSKLIGKLIFILLISWIMIIFYFSHQPANKSNELSKSISNVIVENFNDTYKVNVPINMRNLNNIIRKFSHFGEYTVLGTLMYLASVKSNFLKKGRLIWCVIFCILYAITDEIHQAFVPGRGPKVFDVLIDAGGSMFGALIAKLIVGQKAKI